MCKGWLAEYEEEAEEGDVKEVKEGLSSTKEEEIKV
jgi:hypothetical protein